MFCFVCFNYISLILTTVFSQRYMSSHVRRTNTKATHQDIITLTWMAAVPSIRSSSIVTWQVTHKVTHLHSQTLFFFVWIITLRDCLWHKTVCFHSLCPVFVFPSEDRAWMVIQHNNTELTTVPLSAESNQHLTHFDYASAEEQIAAIIGQSEHCEQELSYLCRKSRLLNTPGKT